MAAGDFHYLNIAKDYEPYPERGSSLMEGIGEGIGESYPVENLEGIPVESGEGTPVYDGQGRPVESGEGVPVDVDYARPVSPLEFQQEMQGHQTTQQQMGYTTQQQLGHTTQQQLGHTTQQQLGHGPGYYDATYQQMGYSPDTSQLGQAMLTRPIFSVGGVGINLIHLGLAGLGGWAAWKYLKK